MNAIGVKMVKSEAMTRGDYNKYRGWENPVNEDPEDKGFLVRYADGYESWCPDKQFKTANLFIHGSNIVTKADVRGFIKSQEILTIGDRTTFVRVVLRNGFSIEETNSCVDVANYDEVIGTEICMEKIYDKIWDYLGFVLCWATKGLTMVDETTH